MAGPVRTRICGNPDCEAVFEWRDRRRRYCFDCVPRDTRGPNSTLWENDKNRYRLARKKREAGK